MLIADVYTEDQGHRRTDKNLARVQRTTTSAEVAQSTCSIFQSTYFIQKKFERGPDEEANKEINFILANNETRMSHIIQWVNNLRLHLANKIFQPISLLPIIYAFDKNTSYNEQHRFIRIKSRFRSEPNHISTLK